jgi:S-adenosylmethionine synthetase
MKEHKKMAKNKYLFTSESVTEGHPDKVADGISDAILDAHLKGDKKSRVACETMVSTGMVVIAGEITSKAVVKYADVVRNTVKEIGYVDPDCGFSSDTCAVLVSLDRQSPDISQGVTAGKGLFKEQGAGDQGMMFGYACDETRELMPMPIMYAHRLTRALSNVRKSGKLNFLRPDGKSQVSVVYEDDKPQYIDTIVVSSQHTPDVSHKDLTAGIIEEVVKKQIPKKLLSKKTRYLINPTGRFVVGGPHGDCGLTGRKIIVDTYGGMGRHGGGAFSGKDPSKVDRSAAYMARYVAKNIVAAKLACRCEVSLAYAIGFANPVSVRVDTFGTGKVADKVITRAVNKTFGLKPAEIIKQLDLLRPVYGPTSAYGHFGRTTGLKSFTWEKTDKAEALAAAI